MRIFLSPPIIIIITFTSTLLKEIRQTDLQKGNGNSFCEFEFTRKLSRAKGIICELRISQDTNQDDMTMNFEHLVKHGHETSKFMKQ